MTLHKRATEPSGRGAVRIADPAQLQVMSSDGTPVAAWRSGAGPSLILVHGTTADHTRWSRVTAGFEARHTVYAMDRRGRGGSGDAGTYSLAQEGEDIVAVAREADPPVSLLGHSYGALCSIEAALRMPDLHRLVLYEPPLPLGYEIVAPAVRAKLTGLLERNELEEALVVFFREVVHVPEPQLRVMQEHPVWAARVAAAPTIAREIRWESEYRLNLDRLATVTVPTLLLLGGDSPRYFREATRQLHAALPNSRVHELAGQQHIAMDMIPDEFVEIVNSFVCAPSPA